MNPSNPTLQYERVAAIFVAELARHVYRDFNLSTANIDALRVLLLADEPAT